MKKGQLLLLLFAFTVAISCGDTVVRYNQQVDDSVDAPSTSGLFKKHVLIEDYTGTWCGYCARVAYAIERGGTTLRDFINPDSEPGYFEQELDVYGREGEPCKQCGRPLRDSRLNNRAGAWCGSCQT